MIFRVTMKDPDTLYYAIEDAIKELHVDGLDDDELEGVKERRKNKVREICSKWFRCGEYLTVEIDTETQSCTVIADE